MKLLYIHGYLGHGNGSASQHIKDALSKRGIDCSVDAPDFDVTNPKGMRLRLTELISQGGYDYVAASSMGAFYLMQVGGITRIMLNPAMPEDLRNIRNSDPEGNPLLTEELLLDLEDEKKFFFDFVLDEKDIAESYFVFGSKDNIAHNEGVIREKYPLDGHIFNVEMGHKMEPSGAEKICDIIEMLKSK